MARVCRNRGPIIDKIGDLRLSAARSGTVEPALTGLQHKLCRVYLMLLAKLTRLEHYTFIFTNVTPVVVDICVAGFTISQVGPKPDEANSQHPIGTQRLQGQPTSAAKARGAIRCTRD